MANTRKLRSWVTVFGVVEDVRFAQVVNAFIHYRDRVVVLLRTIIELSVVHAKSKTAIGFRG